jgi:hypothetical protein
VPDDVIKIGSSYYMTTHFYNGNKYVSAILVSEDLLTWKDYLGTYVNIASNYYDNVGGGLMFFKKDKGIKAITQQDNYNIVAGNFTDRPNNIAISKKTTSTLYPLKGNRSEFINAELTEDSVFEIDSCTQGYGGIVKIIKNNSPFTLTLQPINGVIIDGVSNPIVVKSGSMVEIISIATDEFQTKSTDTARESKPLVTPDTATEITLYPFGNFCNSYAANLETTEFTFVLTDEANPAGESATVLIKTDSGASDFPTLADAEYVEGAPFEADAYFDLYAWHNGAIVAYTFLSRSAPPEAPPTLTIIPD